MVIWGHDAQGASQGSPIGGKAAGLVRLMEAGAEVPPWFVLLPGSDPYEAVEAWRRSGWSRVAVRSSALAEDGQNHSFAGMYESVLGVTAADELVAAVGRCRASANASRVTAYIAEHRAELEAHIRSRGEKD